MRYVFNRCIYISSYLYNCNYTTINNQGEIRIWSNYFPKNVPIAENASKELTLLEWGKTFALSNTQMHTGNTRKKLKKAKVVVDAAVAAAVKWSLKLTKRSFRKRGVYL